MHFNAQGQMRRTLWETAFFTAPQPYIASFYRCVVHTAYAAREKAQNLTRPDQIFLLSMPVVIRKSSRMDHNT